MLAVSLSKSSETSKTMNPKLKSLFAFIGVLLLTFEIYSYVQREITTQKYWENISKVKVGMSLKEARQIIGDAKYQYWTQDFKSGEIIVSENNKGEMVYAVEYDMLFGASDNPKIYFDPKTLIVTEVVKGE